MFSRALVKSFAVKHRLRLTVLGNLRPFALFDKLISSSLLCPGLFPDSSWAEASDLLRQSMDSPALRAWDGKVLTFNPSPSSCPRPFRAALPPPRAPQASPHPWRSDGSAGRSDRRGECNARFSWGRGGRSSRGRSSHTSSTGDAPRQAHNPRGGSRGRNNPRRRYNNSSTSHHSGSRGRAGSSSGHRGRQSGRSY